MLTSSIYSGRTEQEAIDMLIASIQGCEIYFTFSEKRIKIPYLIEGFWACRCNDININKIKKNYKHVTITGHTNQAGGMCCPHHGNTCGRCNQYNDDEIFKKHLNLTYQQ